MNKLQRTLIDLLKGMMYDLEKADRRKFHIKNQEFSSKMRYVREYLNTPGEKTLPPEKARENMILMLQIKQGDFNVTEKKTHRYNEMMAASLQEGFQWIKQQNFVGEEEIGEEIIKELKAMYKAAKDDNRKEFDKANGRFLRLERMFMHIHNLPKTDNPIDLAGNSCVYIFMFRMHNDEAQCKKYIDITPEKIRKAEKFIKSLE